MANVLVTGGGGFIGSHLTTKMVELGHRTRVMDNFATGHRSNLNHIADSIDLFESDLRKYEDCLKACDGIDYVFHQGAIPSVPKSVDKPRDSHEANINGTFNILQAAVECKIKRFVYAASSSAYGNTEESPKHEKMQTNPLSPYASQKHAGETYCRSFYECFGLETIAIRYFNVFGPRQDPQSQYAAAIPAFVTKILKGERPVIYGDGEQTRDFTYIDNVVHGNVLAMQVEKTAGQSVNVACGGQISVNQVIKAINEALGTNVEAEYVPRRTGDVLHSCASIALAKKLLDFEPVVTFEEGLRRAIEYYKTLV